MIVDKNSDRLRVVTQVEHAKLSWEMIDDLLKKEPDTPVEKAVKHHDDGWTEWDSEPGSSDGLPIDYRSMELEDHLDILERSIQRCGDIHPYSAWLISKHGCSFHESKTHEQAQAFLDAERKRRENIARNNSLPGEELRQRDFNVLQFLDALSLFLISPWSTEWSWNRSAPYEISIKSERGNLFLYQCPVKLPSTLKFHYKYKAISERSYSSSEEFRSKMDSVPLTENEIILRNERAS